MYYRAYLKNKSGERLNVDFITTSLNMMIKHIRQYYNCKGWTATIYKGDETIKTWTLRK